jgi:tRNA threonylcarbamoyladenosine biosynthesis protein TsaE
VKKIISTSEEMTRKLGSEYAAGLKENDIAVFYGELGTGKTQFIKGICSSLGVKEIVNSPTFVIVNEYNSSKGMKIFHFDFYRMKSTNEIIDIGFTDYLNKGLMLIEWPLLVENILPAGTKKIFLSHYGDEPNSRLIEFEEQL